MTVEAAGSTINSIWLIVAREQDRKLTPDEREQLERLCEILRQGIPERPIYNRAARDLCALLTSPGFIETEAGMEEAVNKIKGLWHMTG